MAACLDSFDSRSIHVISTHEIPVGTRLETAPTMNYFRSSLDSVVIRLLEIPFFDRIAGYIAWQRRRKTRRTVESRLRSRGGYPNQVLAGPFSGLQFPAQDRFVDARFEKVFGLYEHELFDTLSRWARNPEAFKTIVNVGAADGFYAVGLSRLFPSAVVHAYEMNSRKVLVLSEMAELNHVASRILVSGECSSEELKTLSHKGPVLVVMDVDGAEQKLLDPDIVPWLKEAFILVETHDCFVPAVAAQLKKRFAPTHDLQELKMSGPDWGAVPPLEELSMHEVDALTGSERPMLQTWLIMEPHGMR